jgi:hypothetical protein
MYFFKVDFLPVLKTIHTPGSKQTNKQTNKQQVLTIKLAAELPERKK